MHKRPKGYKSDACLYGSKSACNTVYIPIKGVYAFSCDGYYTSPVEGYGSSYFPKGTLEDNEHFYSLVPIERTAPIGIMLWAETKDKVFENIEKHICYHHHRLLK